LNVHRIEGEDNLYRETEHGFIIKSEDENTLVVLCIEENGEKRPLTEDEKKIASLKGLNIAMTPEPKPVEEKTEDVLDIPDVPSEIPVQF